MAAVWFCDFEAIGSGTSSITNRSQGKQKPREAPENGTFQNFRRVSKIIKVGEKEMEEMTKVEIKHLVETLQKLGFSDTQIVKILLSIEQ